MEYYGLKSIVSSLKQQYKLEVTSSSFFVCKNRSENFIEPKFSKLDKFSLEKPPIILISAVGASGKTTTAQALSADLGVPILDLAKHKPVGAHTLSGILIDHYPNTVTDVLDGLKTGSYGIIIDGVDEGRSKVTEEGFEAFLDNIINLAKTAKGTSIIMLGRGQTLMHTWCYLEDNKVATGLVQIEPFDLEQAQKYIDLHVGKPQSGQQETYTQARDRILETLGAAFQVTDVVKDEFMKFLGYPPVLGAIATLLKQEGNYHKIYSSLVGGTGHDIEVNLLIQIGDYLLDREQKEKAQVNFVNEIAQKIGGEPGKFLQVNLYSKEEQCARVLAHTLGRTLNRQYISDLAINQEYEKALSIWCSEHPFLQENKVRNPVFAAVSLTRCLLSDIEEYNEIAIKYAEKNTPSYFFLYMMGALHNRGKVSLAMCNILMQSCSDFLGVNADVTVELESDDFEEEKCSKNKNKKVKKDDIKWSDAELNINVNLKDKNQEKEFLFKSRVFENSKLNLGPTLVGARVLVPCNINIQGENRIEVFSDCWVSAKEVHIRAPEISMPRLSFAEMDGKGASTSLMIEANNISGKVEAISPKDSNLMLFCEKDTLEYPLTKHVCGAPSTNMDAEMQMKYKRLRRIFVDFRSHSKGGLAKYRAKVENRRVVKNEAGRAILDALVNDGILTYDHSFYYVQPDKLSEKTGINWEDLKHRKTTPQLEKYLSKI